MADLELEDHVIPARTSKQLGKATSLVAGDHFKMELGEDELDVNIPEGEIWDVAVEIWVTIRSI